MSDYCTTTNRERAVSPATPAPVRSREVKWAVEHALQKEAWIPVIAQSELAFYRYRDPDSVVGKAVTLLRHGYGGHPLHKKSEKPGRKKPLK